jgi:hypothetical protein
MKIFITVVVTCLAFSSLGAQVLFLDPAKITSIKSKSKGHYNEYSCDNDLVFYAHEDLQLFVSNYIKAAKQNYKTLQFNFTQKIVFEKQEELEKHLTIAKIKSAHEVDEELLDKKDDDVSKWEHKKKAKRDKKYQSYIKVMEADKMKLTKSVMAVPTRYWVKFSSAEDKVEIVRDTYKNLKKTKIAASMTGSLLKIDFTTFFNDFGVELVSDCLDDTGKGKKKQDDFPSEQ